jgi:hypothetical protein
VSGWWDGQHSGNQGKLKNLPLYIARPPNLKGKNARHIQYVLGHSHWLHEISPPKKVYHHFWPNLYPSQVQLFFIEFDSPWQKKNKNYEGSQKLKFLWIDGVPPPLAHDICEKGRTLSKTYGIKARCDWEHPWGTH